jgi:hypothetical protein
MRDVFVSGKWRGFSQTFRDDSVTGVCEIYARARTDWFALFLRRGCPDRLKHSDKPMLSLGLAVDVSLDQSQMRQPLRNQSWTLVIPKEAVAKPTRKGVTSEKRDYRW